jgi:Xaa-Pro aminopeptidase
LQIDALNIFAKTSKFGMTEIQIAKLMDNYMLSNGATALAFDTIVGSGKNSSLIHSKPGKRRIKSGDIVQLDFGCVVDGYCSDTSRVLFIDYVMPEYKRIYDIVLNSQKKCMHEIKEGMKLSAVDELSRSYIKKYGYNFNHALGHGVGKVVHDEPVISPKNTKDKMKENLVFTIEPGIYLENKFCIRIEYTVVFKEGKVIPLNHTSKKITIIKG